MRALALVLLLVQGTAGAGVAFAHAAELPSSRAAFESAHDSNCLVIHNELRCTICQFAGAHSKPATRHVATLFTTEHFTPSTGRRAALLGVDEHLPAPARAPPVSLV